MSNRRTLEMLARASLNHEDCPNPDQLAAFMLDLLSGNEQLKVADHVRRCPVCQEEVALVRPPEPRPRPLIARLLPTLATGLRGPSVGSGLRQYQAADLTIELTLVPQDGESWRITGQILRGGAPVAGLPVNLRRTRQRIYRQESDAEGFFTYMSLPEGQYTLSVTDGATSVLVRGIDLTDGAG